MLALPSQTPGLAEVLGLTPEELAGEAWAIDRHGQRWGGAAAINRTLQALPRWQRISRLYALRPLRWLEDCIYAWVAKHRGLLARIYGATPECERPGVECEGP